MWYNNTTVKYIKFEKGWYNMAKLDKLWMETPNMTEEQLEILIAGMTDIRSILKHSKNEKNFRKNMNAYCKCLPVICGENVTQEKMLRSLMDYCEWNSDIMTPAHYIEVLSDKIRAFDTQKRAMEIMRKYNAEYEMAYIKKQILQEQMN